MSQLRHRPARARRAALALLWALGAGSMAGAAAETGALPSEPALLRIGTGGEAGTYFPIGSLIARALTEQLGCAGEAPCTEPGVLGIAQLSNGSASNVRAISDQAAEAGFAQADVAYWAYQGKGPFATEGRHEHLRAIANLYPETMHLVSRAEAAPASPAALAGRRVSLDEPGSGTLLDARLVLAAYGLAERDLRPRYLKPQFAAAELAARKLDAFFIVAGYPTRSVTELAARVPLALVPIAAERAAAISRDHPFFTPAVIPAGVYPGVPRTPTLAVGAQLLVDARLPATLVYRVTRVLWSERTRRLLTAGHPKGAEIRLAHALDGLAVPLHLGAARFYRERHLLVP